MREIGDWIVFAGLSLCGLWDWRKKQIPMILLLLLCVAVVALTFLCPREEAGAIVGGILLGVLFFIISKVTGEVIGYGDSWLILLLGIYLGGFCLLQVLFAASLAAGIYSLFVLWRKHWKRRETIPFVPFLVIAYLGVLFV